MQPKASRACGGTARGVRRSSGDVASLSRQADRLPPSGPTERLYAELSSGCGIIGRH